MNAEPTDLFGYDHTRAAIEILRQLEPPEGYYLAFSGGKDSIVLKDLADRAGVKYDAHFHLTTLDPPELIRFVKHEHPNVARERPRHSFFQLLQTYGFPMRHYRWCCQQLKERGHGRGRFVLTGIRRQESPRRARRRQVETCPTETKRYLHPIIEWSETQVWQHIKQNGLPYPSLYDEGLHRIGCIACPMTGRKLRRYELDRWPNFEKALRNAFKKFYLRRKAERPETVARWPDSDAMFRWWIAVERGSRQNKSQISIFE